MSDRTTPAGPPSAADGDPAVLDRYRELRALARQLLFAERKNHSFGPTDLVHEAWLRLSGQAAPGQLSHDEFRRLAATTMRHVLVDHARARARQKRSGSGERIPMDALDLAVAGQFDDLLAVDEAIERLRAKDPALAELVRLRFFAGLTVDETAQALGTSPRSIDREWTLAKALLLRML